MFSLVMIDAPLMMCSQFRESLVDSFGDKESVPQYTHLVAERPAGSDLLYYPKPCTDDSLEGILQTVKAWRIANGLPDFKAV